MFLDILRILPLTCFLFVVVHNFIWDYDDSHNNYVNLNTTLLLLP